MTAILFVCPSVSSYSRPLWWTLTPNSLPSSTSEVYVYCRNQQQTIFVFEMKSGYTSEHQTFCPNSIGSMEKCLPVSVVFHLCQINQCCGTLPWLTFCLFAVAEAAHGENYCVSWANLAPPEWSAGAECMLPCQPFNHVTQANDEIAPKPDSTQTHRGKVKTCRQGTPAFAKYKQVFEIDIDFSLLVFSTDIFLCSLCTQSTLVLSPGNSHSLVLRTQYLQKLTPSPAYSAFQFYQTAGDFDSTTWNSCPKIT